LPLLICAAFSFFFVAFIFFVSSSICPQPLSCIFVVSFLFLFSSSLQRRLGGRGRGYGRLGFFGGVVMMVRPGMTGRAEQIGGEARWLCKA
jgi:hypothetical protein